MSEKTIQYLEENFSDTYGSLVYELSCMKRNKGYLEKCLSNLLKLIECRKELGSINKFVIKGRCEYIRR